MCRFENERTQKSPLNELEFVSLWLKTPPERLMRVGRKFSENLGRCRNYFTATSKLITAPNRATASTKAATISMAPWILPDASG